MNTEQMDVTDVTIKHCQLRTDGIIFLQALTSLLVIRFLDHGLSESGSVFVFRSWWLGGIPRGWARLKDLKTMFVC
jgi:hypothetical protein